MITACKKDDKPQAPVISFKTGISYTQNGSVVAVGRKLYFGIEASGAKENITNFYIQKVLKNGTIITVLDSGLNASGLNVNKTFYQNVEDTVTWTFTVMDRARLSSHITLVVYKDPNSQFGGIYYYPSIKMGYQNNTIYGHYLDPSTGKVYFKDTAGLNQSKMDIIVYQYITSGSPSPVLSSPGEMDNASTDAQTYYPEIINWTARQYTKWDISVDNGTTAPLTATDFDNSQNDSLLIVSYHDVWGKKKFKFATTGKIIPFITAKGKKGLIKIINADNIDGTGMMEFAMKVQQ
jgi:hypothetical protein